MNEPSDGGGTATPPGQPPAAAVVIRCREDGPLVVEIPAIPGAPPVTVRVTDHRGRDFPLPSHKRALALCRCGQTGNRPFCDGSHRNCGFSASDPAPTTDQP